MRSLKFKILVTVGILLTVSNIFLGVYFFSKASVALENQIMISLQQSVHATAEAVEAMNAKELKTLHTLAANPVIRDSSVSLLDKTHVVYGTMSTDKDYVDVAILDEEGFAWINNGAKRIPFSEREYFKVPKNTGNDFVTDPFINKVDNTMAIFYSVPVFDEKNKVINVVFAVADGFKPSNLVEKHPAGNGRIPKIISMKSNLTIASEDHSLVASENLLEQTGSQADGKKYNAVIRDALSGRPKASMYTYQGKEFMEASEKVPGVDWIVTNSVPESDFKADLQKLKFMVVGIIIVLTIIAIIGVAVVIDKVINPLQDLNRAIGEIASGNADLTKRITIHSKDEIGEVVEGFNKFEEKLQNIVTEIKSSKDVLSVVGSDIGDNMQTTGVVIQGMFNDIHNTQDEINVQSQSVNHTVNAITRVSESIESLDEMIENQTHGIAQASAAVEQMMGNINAVNSSVEKMADSFDTLQTQSSSGVTKQKLVSEQIKGIEEQSKILQEANVVISSIANQTNLLAMNAAIEAAHAGEAGKGFSVVADEIRKLSETSTAQSKKISEQLKHIMLSISNVVQASTESSESFNTVTNLISNTDEVVRQIKAAMEEQNVGSKQINDALHDMNDSAGEVRDASRLMAEGNKQILDSVQALQSATSSMSQRMEVLTDRAQQINDSGLELNELADRISSSINEISSQIDQFKV